MSIWSSSSVLAGAPKTPGISQVIRAPITLSFVILNMYLLAIPQFLLIQ